MAFLLTNQNNFPHISYPSPSSSTATVKSGGCGPSAALMVVENLTSSRFLMADWIQWVISTGARVSGGTDMGTLAQALAKRFSFIYSTTSEENDLVAHVRAGGMAIANVGGAYGSWKGLFSTNGHYVTVLQVASDGRLVIGDPDFREGKYSSGTLGKWRAQYVTVKDGLVYVTQAVLHKDTLNRKPNYYLFALAAKNDEIKKEEGEDEMIRYATVTEVPTWGKATVEKLIQQGFLKGTGDGKLDISEDMLRVMVIHDRAGLYGS